MDVLLVTLLIIGTLAGLLWLAAKGERPPPDDGRTPRIDPDGGAPKRAPLASPPRPSVRETKPPALPIPPVPTPGHAPPQQPLRQKYETLTGRCWVVDGDTIMIGKTRIRLWGIDAPEMNHPYGKISKFALVAMVKGQDITATFHGTGSYERAVAHCRLPDGRDIAAELVKQGLALDWPDYSNGHYAKWEPDGVRKKLWRAHARMTRKTNARTKAG
ncbi:thermonuclease family protein [Gymnodinialimonas ulvae]|uniref:thermonuclease family protein n=1 Tax=Gymnodinialimonas ulvae TaxID=3126504 RepID=UPI00309DBD71